jgi:SHS2 domain-containing protein
MPYRYVDHTADIEFVVTARTLPGLFRSAFAATFNTSAEIRKVAKSKSKDVSVKISESASKLDELLWSSLQYATSVGDSRGVFFYRVDAVVVEESEGGYKLSGKLIGKRMRTEYSKLEVKAVSRYNLSLVKSRQGYRAGVVLDV